MKRRSQIVGILSFVMCLLTFTMSIMAYTVPSVQAASSKPVVTSGNISPIAIQVGNTTVYSIVDLPTGFNASTATDEEIARYGFPPRPKNNAGALEIWKQVVSGKRVKPTITPSKSNITKRLPKKHIVKQTITNGSYDWDTTWSGVVSDIPMCDRLCHLC